MSASVPFERLQDEARGDAVSHPCLDNPFRSQVTSQTPNRSSETSIPVVVRAEALRTGVNSFCFQVSHHLAPDRPIFREQRAGPRNAEVVVELMFPIFIRFVQELRLALLALV